MGPPTFGVLIVTPNPSSDPKLGWIHQDLGSLSPPTNPSNDPKLQMDPPTFGVLIFTPNPSNDPKLQMDPPRFGVLIFTPNPSSDPKLGWILQHLGSLSSPQTQAVTLNLDGSTKIWVLHLHPNPQTQAMTLNLDGSTRIWVPPPFSPPQPINPTTDHHMSMGPPRFGFLTSIPTHKPKQ